MTMLLIILATWSLALLLVAGLCTMARLGDAAQARSQRAAIDFDAADADFPSGEVAIVALGATPSSSGLRAVSGDARLSARRVSADVAA
jgi:hypothetical protein